MSTGLFDKISCSLTISSMLGIPGMLKLCSADSCYFPSFQIEGSKIYLYVDAFGGLLLTRMC